MSYSRKEKQIFIPKRNKGTITESRVSHHQTRAISVLRIDNGRNEDDYLKCENGETNYKVC